MGDLVVVTPVQPEREAALRASLRDLNSGESPLARLHVATHFARFVVIPLDGPRLLFSSRFDGAEERYLAALARLPEAAAIWSHCESPDDLSDPPALLRYLVRHRHRSQYILTGWAKESVGEVREALELRARLAGLMATAAERDTVGLAHAFRQTFPQNMIERDEIQGNIVRGYPFPHAAYLFVQVKSAAAGCRLLAELIDPVTTYEEWDADETPPWTLNVALTHQGLAALGLDGERLALFPAEFREGMAERAERLGDRGPSAPGKWKNGLGTGRAHLLLTIYGPEPEARDEQLEYWAGRVTSDPGLARVCAQKADVLSDAREHFGYADGFSQPAVETGGRPANAEGVRLRFRRWRELRIGEFVLGYRDEDGVVAGEGIPLLRNGSFMVWRKLEQNVALFRSWICEQAGDDPADQEWLKAKLVGRWPNGDSLVLSPEEGAGKFRRNHFSYRRDLAGMRCPAGAHVRRANPRDALGWRYERTRRHRLIRRGMPYGPPLAEGATEPDGEDRGLVFVCLQASIARQFEVVQCDWLGDGDGFGLGEAQDLLLAGADGAGRLTVPGRPPRFLPPGPQFVWTRGGEYLFVPGMSALEELARG